MFRIIVFFEDEKTGSEVKTKIEERFETIEAANEWIDKDIEPYIRDQDYHFFDRVEDKYFEFCKRIPLKDDEEKFKTVWRSYLIKGHE